MQFAQVKRAKGGRQQAKKSTLMCDVLAGLVNIWIHETKKITDHLVNQTTISMRIMKIRQKSMSCNKNVSHLSNLLVIKTMPKFQKYSTGKTCTDEAHKIKKWNFDFSHSMSQKDGDTRNPNVIFGWDLVEIYSERK